MKNKRTHVEVAEEAAEPQIQSGLDLWSLMGGKSHRVGEPNKSPDAMIAALGDRVTYTFMLDDEVASIHFDRRRGEIFFKGHNIRHLELTDPQKVALEHMKEVIKSDKKASSLLSDYSATLDRCYADNKSGSRPLGGT